MVSAKAAAAAIRDTVLPPSLKLAELQRVALLCGLATSGTKADIRERIADVTADTADATGAGVPWRDRRILSIDLGLRNLGYGLLTPAPEPRRKKPQDPSPLAPPRVKLHAWTRTDLVAPPAPPSPAAAADPGLSKREKLKEKQRQSEAFSPAALSATAVRLVRNTLLPLRPTHVLIERQRFRSGNAAPVLEWTLRVNTLEAMIHAAFRTLRECGHWEGEVVSVPPLRVGPFWLAGSDRGGGDTKKAEAADTDLDLEELEGETKAAKSKRASSRQAKLNMKKEKIDILGNWLSGGVLVSPQNKGVEAMIQTYFEHWTRKPGARRKKTQINGLGIEEEAIKKIDDLADSLLQGMAWIRWEENKECLKSSESVMKLLSG